jgi:hypothetical protein
VWQGTCRSPIPIPPVNAGWWGCDRASWRMSCRLPSAQRGSAIPPHRSLRCLTVGLVSAGGTSNSTPPAATEKDPWRPIPPTRIHARPATSKEHRRQEVKPPFTPLSPYVRRPASLPIPGRTVQAKTALLDSYNQSWTTY